MAVLAVLARPGSQHRTAVGAPASTVAPAPTTITTVPVPTTPPPVTSPPITAAPTAAVARPPVAGGGVAIGDSVLEDVKLYAPATLASRGIAVNAAVSRQWRTGITIVSQLRAAGQLPAVVLVVLGSNGVINAGLFDQMMQACAGARRVVFMTVTGPLIGNNPIISAGVARHPGAVLADWAAVSAGHPDWFAADGVHVGPLGSAALGNLLASVA